MTPTYSKYKTTNIPWLPSVPDEWDIVKTKYLFRERVQKDFGDEPLLAATQSQGVIPKSLYETTTVTAQKDFHLLKLVTIGDFVISLRSFQGGIEYAYYRGIISPAYTVFFSKNIEEVNPQFFRYFFKSQPFVKSLTLFVTGIREGQNIDYNEFKNSLLPVPPPEEQTAIANYLDAQNEKINLFIAKKQKLIELLKEQKQKVINDAMTKGVNENAKLINTKFEWIKSIPEKWEIRKLKYCAKLYGRIGFHGLTSTDYKEEGIVLVTGTDLLNDEIVWETCVRVDDSWYDKDDKIQIIEGDFLITKDGTIGKTAIAKNVTEKTILNSGLMVVRPFYKNFHKEYFLYVIKSEIFTEFISLKKVGATVQHLYQETFYNFNFPIPPTIEEQKEIVQHIKTETKRIDEAINRIEKEIELIKEYRQSIIAEVVTGKIKVS